MHGIVSVRLGPSGFGDELRICERRFDSSHLENFLLIARLS